MFRFVLFVWLSGQVLASAGTLPFTEAEIAHVNSTARLESLPAALQQRVADNTLSWMTEASSHVLNCWAEFGSRAGVIADPRPSPTLVRHARETCAAALRSLSADSGPALRTADMVIAVTEFLQASRTAVDAAIRALDDGVTETARHSAIAQFDSYSRTLETGRLPVWMLRAVNGAGQESGFVRSA